MFEARPKAYRGCINLRERNSSWTKIVELVDEGRRVLEVGCAEGHMAEFLSRYKHCPITGIEMNPEAAEVASAHCESIVIGDVEQGALERVQGTFDVVIFADVLEHLRYPGDVLRATHPLLNEGGYVLISLPNVAHWEVRRSLIRGRFEYTKAGLLDDSHLRFFTYETALKLIDEAGFYVGTFELVHRCPRFWKYPNFYRRRDAFVNRLVKKYFRGIFGYQFVFKILPKGQAGVRILATKPSQIVSCASRGENGRGD